MDFQYPRYRFRPDQKTGSTSKNPDPGKEEPVFFPLKTNQCSLNVISLFLVRKRSRLFQKTILYSALMMLPSGFKVQNCHQSVLDAVTALRYPAPASG